MRKYAEGNEIADQIYALYQSYKNGPRDIDPGKLLSKDHITRLGTSPTIKSEPIQRSHTH